MTEKDSVNYRNQEREFQVLKRTVELLQTRVQTLERQMQRLTNTR